MNVVKKPLGLFWKSVVYVIYVMTAISGAGLFLMMAVTCCDVVLRATGFPVKGSYDVVRICGVITMACALPLTTAMKGHIAIEYFFQKLNRLGRLIVDSIMRLVSIGAFSCAAVACISCGQRLLAAGEVTSTIEIPIFWVPWVMAVAFGVTAIVVVFHLIYPGRDMMKIGVAP
jgi:TRAP-type C4-dicarboxylate transport system permease small subunit